MSMVLDTGLRYDQLESLSDEELCALGRAGRRQAEDVLATRYHWLVRACARPYFLIGGDTEDLMQEGMFGLIKAMREFDPARSSLFRPFAGLCIHQQVCSALKRDASQKNAPLNQSVPLNSSLLNASPTFAQVDPELLLIDREKAASLLENTRKQLSAFEEKILGLFLDGLAYCEIAETVGRPIKSVDNAVQRIRRKVARQLSSGDISNS